MPSPRPSSGRAAKPGGRSGITFEDMAARRAERLVNLVICLLSTRQFLSAERIRTAVPGYEAATGDPKVDEAFKRMFERDKSELRDLGIPLETGRNSAFDGEDGYRITRREYELPPIEFDPVEAAAVGLAARFWQSATLGSAARAALVKLRAGGIDLDAGGTPGAQPYLDASDPALPPILDAARNLQPVRFDYLKSGAEQPEVRTVEPWGVLSWRRRWYLVGHDRDREDARSFRLSRITGTVRPTGHAGQYDVPEKVDLLEMVTGGFPEETLAHVRVSGTGAGQLRRIAESREPAGADTEVLAIRYYDAGRLSRLIAAAGTSAVALDPPELRRAVRDRLAALLPAGSTP